MEKLKHPKGLYFLFFTEMWERFSFYGLAALLVLYMTQKLHYGEDAQKIYGNYVTYLYITTAIGGMLADRVIGYRRCVLAGGINIMIGHICLGLSYFNNLFLFLGLGFISAGTGLFKANVSVIVGKLYDSLEPLRNSGFAYFYTGINIGALLATVIVGFVGEKIGWHWGFSLAAVGMLAGLIIFEKGKKHYPENVDNPAPWYRNPVCCGLSPWNLVIAGILLIAFGFAYIIAHPVAADFVTGGSLLVLAVFIISVWKSLVPHEKKHIFMILVLSLFMVFFWSLNNQTSTSLPVYIKNFVDRSIFGFEMLTTTVMSIQILLLTVLTPVFGLLWYKLSNRNAEPGDDVKFFLALAFISMAFGFMFLGSRCVPVSMWWIILCYIMLAFGELCISPVGLALVTRLAPARLTATMMGVWWTISSYAGWAGGKIGAMAFTGDVENISVQGFEGVYFWLFIAAFAAAVLLMLLIPIIRKLK